jgi:hypothetical protein
MATIMNLTLLRFLTSHRVPGGCPGLFTDTFTSHLSEPWDTSSDGEERARRRTHELHAAIASPYGPEHGLKSANILARLLWRPRNRKRAPFERDPGVDVTLKRTSCPVQKRFPSAPNPLG